MTVTHVLRINMTGLQENPAAEARRYQAALDMCEFVEEQGFSIINFEEHHCAANGWLPSPLIMAGMALARTRKVNVSVTALLVTLYDPVRLAEDIAVLDLASNGRFSFVAGQGYRPEEYHAVNKHWEDRGKLTDEVIDTLLKAWSGKPFDYHGNTVRITPVPKSQPHPFFFLGGMSKAAAKRAARFGVPFYPPLAMPELEALYYSELKKHGKKGFVYSPGAGNAMLFIDDNPEAAWQELGPYFLNESLEYANWKQEGVPRPSEDAGSSIEALKASGRYRILTPQQCLQHFKENPDTSAVVHPLAGGIPVERAWQMLKLYCSEVAAKLQKPDN
ncbi:MAG: LLM class flavin-dependent oxidoreductase [Pseudomonadales bacterium]|nr:LLM class flavin-dependent oxidoreductase [Pseudomonadales bacterium]